MPSSRSRSWRKRIGMTLTLLLLGGAVALGVILTTSEHSEPPPLGAAQTGGGPAAPAAVTALGRLEPKDRVRHVAGPSNPSVVIGALYVAEGDPVAAGQTIAVLDNHAVLEATVARLQAELDTTTSQFERRKKLFRTGVLSADEHDTWEQRVTLLTADLHRARAELALATVRAPIDGRVLKIHTRAGERVGPDGILELGDTDHMYAVAEVYETDVPRLRVGQAAIVRSRAFPDPLHGAVERVGLQVAKMDVLHTDPVAKTDARVVEVEIRLADAQRVAGLTNLQVEVVIAP